MKNTNILAIIPARGGSKGIPGKNIKNFCGKPLLAWTILAGIKSGVLGKIILSTDSEEIAKIAKKFGAEVPFIRPADLARDDTPTLPVIIHAVSWLREKYNYNPDYVVLLEPTSPCRKPEHIKEAVRLAIKTSADSVMGMIEVPHQYNPHWQFKVAKNGKAELFTGGSVGDIISRRQELSETYVRNGAMYVFKTKLLFGPKPSIYGKNSRAYIMPPQYSVDINTIEDWAIAKKVFKKNMKTEPVKS